MHIWAEQLCCCTVQVQFFCLFVSLFAIDWSILMLRYHCTRWKCFSPVQMTGHVFQIAGWLVLHRSIMYVTHSGEVEILCDDEVSVLERTLAGCFFICNISYCDVLSQSRALRHILLSKAAFSDAVGWPVTAGIGAFIPSKWVQRKREREETFVHIRPYWESISLALCSFGFSSERRLSLVTCLLARRAKLLLISVLRPDCIYAHILSMIDHFYAHKSCQFKRMNEIVGKAAASIVL